MWNNNFQSSFEELKTLVSTTLVLHRRDWTPPFDISSDNSDTIVRVVLGKEEDKNPYAIYYVNKNLALA